MTDEARIARMTKLAGRVWSDAEVRGGTSRALVETVSEWGNAIDIQHPRALEALEAALLVLAGDLVLTGEEGSLMRPDIQRIVEANVEVGMAYTQLLLDVDQLASEWEADIARYADDPDDRVQSRVQSVRLCIRDLRARANGAPHG